MQYTTTLLLAASAALVHAQSDVPLDPASGGDAEALYIRQVCTPTNSSGYPDMSAPCNEVLAVQAQCTWGPSQGLSIFYGLYGADSNSTEANSTLSRRQLGPDSGDGDDGDDLPLVQSNSTQRLCVCESQFFDLIQGCVTCEKAHGSKDDEASFSGDFIASMSSAYCAASATPSLDLNDFLNSFAASSLSSTATATFSDSIGSKTDVSLYYTQAVTGSAAWVVAEATSTDASSSGATSAGETSANTVSGQIRPTASGATSASGSGSAAAGSGTGTGTSKAGAMRTEAAAVAGVLGFAGLIALL